MLARFLITGICLAALIGCATVETSTEEQPDLRVEIWAGAPEVELSLTGEWRIESENWSQTITGDHRVIHDSGQVLKVVTPNGGFHLSNAFTFVPLSEGATCTVQDVPHGAGWWWESAVERTFTCTLEFNPWSAVAPPEGHPGFIDEPEPVSIQVVGTLPMEEYLRGVVPNEIGGDSPPEALKAQAVAARTNTLQKLQQSIHPDSNVDCCAEVHCMAFGGAGTRSEAADAAVAATRGLVLMDDAGVALDAVYASNCGGWAEAIENVWPSRVVGTEPPFVGLTDHLDSPVPLDFDLTTEADLHRWVDDPPAEAWCSASREEVADWTRKNWRWEREFTAAEVEEMIKRGADGVGQLLAIEPLERGRSGRLIRVLVRGTEGERTVGPELTIRMLFHTPLKSAACYFVPGEADENGVPQTWTVRGAGWGHGVGMCQTSAIAQGNSGKTFREILAHHYPGAALTQSWE